MPVYFPRIKAKPKLPLPPGMVGQKSTLYEQFMSCADKFNDNKDEAIQRLKMLPKSIKGSDVWFNQLSNIWVYEYGVPYKLHDGTTVYGSNVFLSVDELYLAIKIADKRLKRQQLLAYLKLLENRAKHYDYIFEMRPLKDVRASLHANYEVAGLGSGKTTVDWQVKGRFIDIVFDVKYRQKSLIDHLEQTTFALGQGAAKARAHAPDPKHLFRSTEKKFKEKCYLRQLQGVWVGTEIMEDVQKLTHCFNKELNRKKIHFLIISGWASDAFVISRNLIVTRFLKRVFCLTESTRFSVQDFEGKDAVELVRDKPKNESKGG